MVNNTKQENEDELMIAITPHVVSNFSARTPEIWVPEVDSRSSLKLTQFFSSAANSTSFL